MSTSLLLNDVNNPLLAFNGSYTKPLNQSINTAFFIALLSGTCPDKNFNPIPCLDLLYKNPKKSRFDTYSFGLNSETKATATLAIPIAATPTATDTLVPKIGTTTLATVTVGAGETQAQVRTAVLAAYNANLLGYTFTGTITSNVLNLVGTAPGFGTGYNGVNLSFTQTGNATFGSVSPVATTFSGGLTDAAGFLAYLSANSISNTLVTYSNLIAMDDITLVTPQAKILINAPSISGKSYDGTNTKVYLSPKLKPYTFTLTGDQTAL